MQKQYFFLWLLQRSSKSWHTPCSSNTVEPLMLSMWHPIKTSLRSNWKVASCYRFTSGPQSACLFRHENVWQLLGKWPTKATKRPLRYSMIMEQRSCNFLVISKHNTCALHQSVHFVQTIFLISPNSGVWIWVLHSPPCVKNWVKQNWLICLRVEYGWVSNCWEMTLLTDSTVVSLCGDWHASWRLQPATNKCCTTTVSYPKKCWDQQISDDDKVWTMKI